MTHLATRQNVDAQGRKVDNYCREISEIEARRRSAAFRLGERAATQGLLQDFLHFVTRPDAILLRHAHPHCAISQRDDLHNKRCLWSGGTSNTRVNQTDIVRVRKIS